MIILLTAGAGGLMVSGPCTSLALLLRLRRFWLAVVDGGRAGGGAGSELESVRIGDYSTWRVET